MIDEFPGGGGIRGGRLEHGRFVRAGGERPEGVQIRALVVAISGEGLAGNDGGLRVGDEIEERLVAEKAAGGQIVDVGGALPPRNIAVFGGRLEGEMGGAGSGV